MKQGKKVPLRKCAGCGQMKEKRELLRILQETDTHQLIIDPTGKKNGRGCYLCISPECFAAARKNHGIERSLKCTVPADFWDRLEKETGFADR